MLIPLNLELNRFIHIFSLSLMFIGSVLWTFSRIVFFDLMTDWWFDLMPGWQIDWLMGLFLDWLTVFCFSIVYVAKSINFLSCLKFVITRTIFCWIWICDLLRPLIFFPLIREVRLIIPFVYWLFIVSCVHWEIIIYQFYHQQQIIE